MKMNQVTSLSSSSSVVDLFCGAGGLSFGLKQAGFKIAAGVDLDEACRFPYETNNGAPFLRKDVTALTGDDLKSLFPSGARSILVGCAPCQPFSPYNQKNRDPKWRLLEVFGRLIATAAPDVVSMENVPALLRFQGGKVFEEFIARLRGKSYKVCWGILYGPNYGLAQTRSRLVLLASRLGTISLPASTHRRPYRTIRDELTELPPLEAGQTDPHDPLHRSSRLSNINRQRMTASRPGGNWRDWPAELVADCHRQESGRSYSSVYGRMSWDEPSPTITTQFYGFGNGRFGHPQQDRALSLREGAMLQGFPYEYQFVAPANKVQMRVVGRMIGNAVPVTMAQAIGQAICDHLEDHP